MLKELVDYSKSAEKLVNPPEVKALLDKLHDLEGAKKALETQLKAENTELVQSIVTVGVDLNNITKQIKEAVDLHGSYQVVGEAYAVKYRRESKQYHPEKFAGPAYEKYRTAVITEAIDTDVLNALIKGGQLEQAILERDGVISFDYSFAYYVR